MVVVKQFLRNYQARQVSVYISHFRSRVSFHALDNVIILQDASPFSVHNKTVAMLREIRVTQSTAAFTACSNKSTNKGTVLSQVLRHEDVWGTGGMAPLFLISALNAEWSASRPSRITPGERGQGTHWIGGWMGPRAGLDAVR
jgi:hypothetical protein